MLLNGVRFRFESVTHPRTGASHGHRHIQNPPPSLQQARRQANSVKCLAALREIGNGFMMYGVENKQYWPTARFDTAKPEIRWPIYIAKYMTNQPMTTTNDINLLRTRSVLWGCPEWSKSLDWNDAASASSAEKRYLGYGM